MDYYTNFINLDSLLGCQSSCVKIRMGCVSNSRELGCVWRCVTTRETKQMGGLGFKPIWALGLVRPNRKRKKII